MSRASILAGSLLAGLVFGCDADVPAGDGPAWIEVAATRFAADGESELVMIPAADTAAALAVRVTTEPGVCFQLSGLIDGDGEVLIDGRSPGPFCRDCEPRSSIAVEAGLFLLGAEAVALADEGVSLRVGRIACETLTPLRPVDPSDRPALRVDVQPIPSETERATLDLRLLVASDSIFAADPARQRALVSALANELAAAGLTPRLVASIELDAAAGELRFHAGDPSALAALLAGVPRAEHDPAIDVVIGGCLRYDDPVFGPPRAVEGYTPRIPGGAGPADAVFLPGRDCLTHATLAPSVEAQARVLAHELGHYLGLFHTVEADGLTDTLADTDEHNLMHFRPGLASSVGWSPTQGRIMRQHLAARAGVAAHSSD